MAGNNGAKIDSWLHGGKLSHATLLCGYAAGEAAETAAAMLLCERTEACGVCRGCLLRANGTHPDLHIISAEKSIKIEVIRQLQEALSKMPQHGQHVVRIDGADLMTPQAQNALLKTLEEPPDNTYFLLTGNEAGLLPTVCSRCSIVRFGDQPPDFGGLLGEARELLALIISGDKGASLRYAAHKGDMGALLECQAILIRDAIAAQLKVQPVMGGYNAKSLDINTMERIIELLTKAKARIRSNANAALTADWLCIQLAREIKR